MYLLLVAYVWLLICVKCICWYIWVTVYQRVPFFNVVLWSVNTAYVYVWNVFYFCAQYTCLTYRVESVVYLCTVHISDVLSEKCSDCVHTTHFWCTVRKVFWLCAPYTFLIYCLESVLFLRTVHICDVPPGKFSVCVHSAYYWCTFGRCSVSVRSKHF